MSETNIVMELEDERDILTRAIGLILELSKHDEQLKETYNYLSGVETGIDFSLKIIREGRN